MSLDLAINNNTALCQSLVDHLIDRLDEGLVGDIGDITGNADCSADTGDMDGDTGRRP